MDQDDGKRGERGLLLSLQFLQNGKVRIIFDDVVSTAENVESACWKASSFFTHADVPMEKILEFDFSNDELHDFGEMTLARLRAYVSVLKKSHPCQEKQS